MTCEFCTELNAPTTSRFAQLYLGKAESRIVAQHGNLVAMPTLGQLFPGSLLALPVTHVETTSSLSELDWQELEVFIAELEHVIGHGGPVLVYEHGAQCQTRGGCGIYHAHVHLVPVPSAVSLEVLLHDGSSPVPILGADTLSGAWKRLTSSTEYLVVRDTESRVGYLDVARECVPSFGSQYMRRRLVDLFHLNRPWDWREYNSPEAAVFNTIQFFRESRDVVGR